MKIGIFTDSYLPYTSGVVRSIETFTGELKKLGHEVFIFAPKYPNCPKEERVFRFASIPAPTNPDYTLAVPFSFRFKSTVQRIGLDIIHVHSPFMLGRLGARYAKKKKIPLVFTFHTLYDQYVHYVPFAQSITREITQKICSDFCNHCDHVIVPTTIIGDYLKRIGVKCGVSKIPTGIDLEDYINADSNWLRKHYNLPPNKKILLFVGRLGKEKNILFLIKCFKQIQLQLPDTHLVIVGGGPEEQELKNHVLEMNLEENITFTGILSRSAVINAYSGADLFIFSSITETQGIVIAEAKAAGLPVVAVNAFGVSEMVIDKEDGFLTDLSEDNFVSKVLILLQHDQLRKAMSRRAKINAEKISALNCTLNLLNTYEALIQNRVFTGSKNGRF